MERVKKTIYETTKKLPKQFLVLHKKAILDIGKVRRANKQCNPKDVRMRPRSQFSSSEDHED